MRIQENGAYFFEYSKKVRFFRSDCERKKGKTTFEVSNGRISQVSKPKREHKQGSEVLDKALQQYGAIKRN